MRTEQNHLYLAGPGGTPARRPAPPLAKLGARHGLTEEALDFARAPD